jgi:hypothetical protein
MEVYMKQILMPFDEYMAEFKEMSDESFNEGFNAGQKVIYDLITHISQNKEENLVLTTPYEKDIIKKFMDLLNQKKKE